MGDIVGAIFGGDDQSDAANQAMQAQTAAQDRAIAESRATYQDQKGLAQPGALMGAKSRATQILMTGGTQADADAYLRGVEKAWNQPDGSLGTAAPYNLEQDPAYQWQTDQGTKAIQASAAAKSGLFSGATAKALSRFVNGTATNAFSDTWNRYGQLAGDANAATSSTSANRGALGINISNGEIAKGDAQASNYITQGNIDARKWGALGGLVDIGSKFIPGVGAITGALRL